MTKNNWNLISQLEIHITILMSRSSVFSSYMTRASDTSIFLRIFFYYKYDICQLLQNRVDPFLSFSLVYWNVFWSFFGTIALLLTSSPWICIQHFLLYKFELVWYIYIIITTNNLISIPTVFMVLICFSIWFINVWLTSLYFFCNSLKISIDYKWYRHLLMKVGEFQDVIIFLRNFLACWPLITIQLVLWFSTSSLLKHCGQYI